MNRLIFVAALYIRKNRQIAAVITEKIAEKIARLHALGGQQHVKDFPARRTDVTRHV